MRQIAWATVMVTALLASGCSTTANTTTAVPGATVPSASSPISPEALPFTETSGLLYATIDGADMSMDVFAPTGEGPWPVVVAFHGRSSAGKDFVETVALAEEAARRGMVVFTPTWLVGNPFPASSGSFERWDDTVSCAVAFAQQKATEFGGDPNRTVIEGFSAGAGAALLFASRAPRVDPVPGCASDASPGPVAGFVLGDADTWLHSQNFDSAFEAEPAAMQERVAAMIGPNSWSLTPKAGFFVWVGVDDSGSRRIGDPDDPSGWFARRDPDGSIQADLESIDQFGDGVVSYIDAARLLELRLSRAGFPVTLDLYAGGHTMLDKLPEIVTYLSTAAR